MIRNVVCDMGGVLIAWDPPSIVNRFGLCAEDAAKLLREVFQSPEWTMQDRGVIPQEEILSRMCRRLPPHLHKAAAECVYGWWKPPFTPMNGIENLLRELKQNGYSLYILSNASRALHEYFHRLPASDVFSGLFVSADYGLLKPEQNIFQKFFETFQIRPEECFFIDDNPMNIEAAFMVGMQGSVFFGDTARLRRELIEAGVNVSK